MTRLILASLCCLAVIQSYFGTTTAAESDQQLGAIRNYLARVELQQNGKPHHLTRRLPPLVPPSFADEDHFDERQVYGIPRVGRSSEDLFSFEGAEQGDAGEEFGDRARVQTRQVFSKIPRVGRSARSVNMKKMAWESGNNETSRKLVSESLDYQVLCKMTKLSMEDLKKIRRCSRNNMSLDFKTVERYDLIRSCNKEYCL